MRLWRPVAPYKGLNVSKNWVRLGVRLQAVGLGREKRGVRKKMNEEPELVVDAEKIKKCVQAGIPLTITSYTLPHSVEMYITQVLAVFLKYAGQESFKDYIEYCVQELAVNAKKANTKRIYFLEKNLDINNAEQYQQGMAYFKKDTISDIDRYLKTQKENGCYIKVVFVYKKESILIEVRNNFVLSKIELSRIRDKIARARQYNNLGDAFNQVLDDSEGAGLGLVVLVLMLKKVGLDENCFKITGTDTETVASITLPHEQTKISHISALTNVIVESVKGLPQFPEHIAAIQKLLNNPEVVMVDIAKRIAVDPSMTADLIKLVNSPLYMTAKRVDNITSAIKIIGTNGVKNLLYSYGTQNVLGRETEEKKLLWNHCYKTAFYSYNIVRSFGKDKKILDDSYTCAMLHDMGKIIFSKNVPKLSLKLERFCKSRNIPQVALEDISAGTNHAEIGALVAEKWNFPPSLVAAIRFHHEPTAAPEKFRSLVDAVYLANMFCEIELGHAEFEQIERSALLSFKFEGIKHLETVAERLAHGFENDPKSAAK
jgi:putative nucleotidyltransferase with HDIG domain